MFNDIKKYNTQLEYINKINGDAKIINQIINEATTEWYSLLQHEESVNFWKPFVDLYLRKSLGYLEAPCAMGNILGIVFGARVTSYLKNGTYEEGPYGDLNGDEVKLLHTNYSSKNPNVLNHYNVFTHLKNQRYIHRPSLFLELIHLERAVEFLPNEEIRVNKNTFDSVIKKIKEYPDNETQISRNVDMFIEEVDVRYTPGTYGELAMLALSFKDDDFTLSVAERLNVDRKTFYKKLLSLDERLFKRALKNISEKEDYCLGIVKGYEKFTYTDVETIFNTHRDPDFDRLVTIATVDLDLNTDSLRKILGVCYDLPEHHPKDKLLGAIERLYQKTLDGDFFEHDHEIERQKKLTVLIFEDLSDFGTAEEWEMVNKVIDQSGKYGWDTNKIIKELYLVFHEDERSDIKMTADFTSFNPEINLESFVVLHGNQLFPIFADEETEHSDSDYESDKWPSKKVKK